MLEGPVRMGRSEEAKVPQGPTKLVFVGVGRSPYVA